MSKLDGITKSRSKVGDSYKGFSIIHVIAIHHWYNNFDRCYEMSRQFETKREVYYEFCKVGDENKPSQAYGVTEKSIAAIKECIDKMLSGEEIYFTDAEREKYIYRPNRKCHWAYGYDSLMQILRQHKKADKRMKILLEDRLDDANFHYEAGLLGNENYKEYEESVIKNFQFREKFEIITHTPKKRLKDPKELLDGLKKVLDEFFKTHETTVEVKFIEDW